MLKTYLTTHLKGRLCLREDLRMELLEGVPQGIEAQKQRAKLEISLFFFITFTYNDLFMKILFLQQNR